MKLLELDPIISSTREKLDKLGVKGILYDLDDTLIYTAEIFYYWMNEYADIVSFELGIEREMFYKTLSAVNDEEYRRMGVSPSRWRAVRLGKMYDGGRSVVEGRLDVLMNIYKTVPRMRPGVRAALGTLKELGFRQALITHANEDWTMWKLDKLGLWDNFDAIFIADENGHKSAQHWNKGMDMLGLTPNKCLVVGDNLGGDITPAASLGARTIWMPSPWSVYRAGTVPEGTVQIGEFNEFLEALARLK